MEAVKEWRENGTLIRKSLTNKYDTPDVRSALWDMYNGLCCYCEGRIRRDMVTENIEHRMPKDKKWFPKKTYEWNNLHLSCPKCNRTKGNKWDKKSPILDSVDDVPISRHLKYNMRTSGLPKLVGRTDKGRITVQHVELNRDLLVDRRAKVFCKISEMAKELRNTFEESGYTEDLHDLAQEISEKTKGPDGTFVQWSLDWHDVNDTLREIYEAAE